VVGVGHWYRRRKGESNTQEGSSSVSGSRLRSRRLGAILATALFTIALVPGLATAADTRILWIGAPDLSVDTVADGVFRPDNAGNLFASGLPTRVSVPADGKGPYATMFQVEILNSGGQNLANTVLTIDANATGNAKLALVKFYDPDNGHDADSNFCPATTTNVITCDYASLGAGQSRTVAVVVSVSAGYVAPASPGVLFKASVTTNNENGSNAQTFTASSNGPLDANGDPIPNSPAFAVEANGADTLSTFVLDGVTGENLSTSDVTGTNKLNSNITFNTSNKELVQINEATSGDGTTGFYKCPDGLHCESQYSEVSTTSGFFDSAPFFTWTLTAVVPKTYALSQGFVAHYPVGAKTFDFTDKTNKYWILYFKNKSAFCPTSPAALPDKITADHQCISALSLTKFDKTYNKLVVTVIMDHQGGLKY